MQLQWRLYLPVALTIVTLIGALTSSATWSHAGQTIRLILPFPPGGPADVYVAAVREFTGAVKDICGENSIGRPASGCVAGRASGL